MIMTTRLRHSSTLILLILLMAKILHQLRLVVYPIIIHYFIHYLQGFIHPRWFKIAGFLNHQQ